MWFQRVSSVDVGGRCLYRAFPMHALAGCKLLSGCLKSCGTSSETWRCFLIGAVLALFSSSWSAALNLASLSLWIFPGLPGVLLTFWDCYKLFVFDFWPDLFRWLGAHVLRCHNPAFGRSRWGDGVKVGHWPGTVKGSLMIKNPI